jgi:tetratricopeptide (TPR) repeat protein
VTTRFIAIVLAALLVAPAAGADPATQAKADALFEKAQGAFQAGDYQQAIDGFKQAYELVHDPVYLFNLAQSYRKIFECEPAYENYKLYLAAVPKAENRAKVEQWLKELQPCVDKRHAEVEAARRAQEEEAARRQRDVGDRHAAEPLTPAPAVTHVDRGAKLRLAGIVTGAVGVVGIGLGLVYSAKGSSIKSDLATACSPTCNWNDPKIEKLDADGRSANTMAVVGYVGGGLALAGGVTLYLLGRARVEHVVVMPAEHGATVSAWLSF